MSSVSTSRPKKVDPLSKKIPENPKYKNVKSSIDTGASVTKYMEKIEEMRSNYRYKKDERFKRMKITTFIQLVVQVAEYENTNTPFTDRSSSFRPDTADEEVYRIQRGEGDRSPAPSLALTEGDYGAPMTNNNRSTLQGVVKGQGELSKNNNTGSDMEKNVLDGCPYLLLDVREKDLYDACHIITARSYPKAMLSRENYETKDMLAFKNRPGKIIVVYDDAEVHAPECVLTLFQRGYDNMFLLSGGMKVAYKIFPEGLFTGPLSSKITDEKTPRAFTREEGNRNSFTQDDLNKINIYLDNALCDKSSGSRLSNASTMSSRTSINTPASSRSLKPSASVTSGRLSHHTPFK